MSELHQTGPTKVGGLVEDQAGLVVEFGHLPAGVGDGGAAGGAAGRGTGAVRRVAGDRAPGVGRRRLNGRAVGRDAATRARRRLHRRLRRRHDGAAAPADHPHSHGTLQARSQQCVCVQRTVHGT